jgi:acyl carrier protein
MNNTILGRVRAFIEENFLFREDVSSLSDDDSLLENGVMDSTGILELVAFLEGEFALQMSDAEIVPENLDSIASIAAYVGRKQAVGIAA